MPELLEKNGGHLPHRDYIARVVAELVALGRGPQGWTVGEERDPVGGVVLEAVLGWGAGSHEREGAPGPDAGLVLTVTWDGEAGWSYVWDGESDIVDSCDLVELGVPADCDPAVLARRLVHVMDDEDDPARLLVPEHLYDTCPDIWNGPS